MEQFALESMEPKKSREERLREAKMLFRDVSSSFSKEEYEDMPETFVETERTFSFYRPLFTLLLFVLLVSAFRTHVSFRGIDRDRVEQVLSDDTHYQQLVKQAEMVIKYFGTDRKE